MKVYPVKLVVAGICKSGTVTFRNMLESLGIFSTVTHEHLFSPVVQSSHSTCRNAAEVSWAAAPHIGRLDPSTKTIHLVRNPQDCIASLSRCGITDLRSRGGYHGIEDHHARLMAGYMGRWTGCRDRVQYADHMWHRWNTMLAGKCHLTVLIEDLNTYETARSILSLIGGDPNLADRIVQCPRLNITKGSPPKIQVSDQSMELASRLGYKGNP